MPTLIIILIFLMFRALTLPGAIDGVKFYLEPDFSKIGPQTILIALGQAFFSLSLGMGAMLTYGSYLPAKENLTSATVYIVLFDTLIEHPIGGLLASPVADTLKRADGASEPEVRETVDRGGLWRAFTPQMFRYGALADALQKAVAAGQPVTDESSAMEFSGNMPVLVEGRPDNIKVTVPADLELASFILGRF